MFKFFRRLILYGLLAYILMFVAAVVTFKHHQGEAQTKMPASAQKQQKKASKAAKAGKRPVGGGSWMDWHLSTTR